MGGSNWWPNGLKIDPLELNGDQRLSGPFCGLLDRELAGVGFVIAFLPLEFELEAEFTRLVGG